MLDALALTAAIALLATWGAYPVVVAALAALPLRRERHKRRDPAPAEPASVSVVIATREDDATIEARVLDLLRTDYDLSRLEVVVALDATGAPPESRDLRLTGLPAHAARVVRVVRGDEPGGKAATLNAGVRAAGGDVLVFADAHQRFQPAAVRELVAALADPRVGAVSGSYDLPEGARERSPVGWYWLYERWLRRNEARVHSSVGVTGAIYAMRRALWQPLPAGLILDDVYAPMRLVLGGHRVAFTERARAKETRRTVPAQEYRRKVRTLTGVIQLCAWLPAVLVPVRNPIWLQFVFHKLMRLLTPYLVLAMALWLAAAGGRWLLARPTLGLAVVSAAAAAAYVARANVGRVLREMMVIQGAVVMATLNGFRGRWDVWQR